MKKLEENSMENPEGSSMEKLGDNSLDQVAGGATIYSYCDKCHALLSTKEDGKDEEIIIPYRFYRLNGERIRLCSKCKVR